MPARESYGEVRTRIEALLRRKGSMTAKSLAYILGLDSISAHEALNRMASEGIIDTALLEGYRLVVGLRLVSSRLNFVISHMAQSHTPKTVLEEAERIVSEIEDGREIDHSEAKWSKELTNSIRNILHSRGLTLRNTGSGVSVVDLPDWMGPNPNIYVGD